VTELSEEQAPSAAVLLIGNELLSGRTQDSNLAYIASRMDGHGIRLLEARVIPDEPDGVINSINELRTRHTYLFTTGGIGPTHDDITADCVAKAFGVTLPHHPEATQRLLEYFAARDIEPNEDRLRMARIPEGASLVDNPVSAAPGFRMQNVFVFAGVPRIMQAMLDSVIPQLRGGAIMHSVTVACDLGEGSLASALRALQAQFSSLDIGSYPGLVQDEFRLSLVVRGTDQVALEQARLLLIDAIAQMGGKIL